jgi:hypothetical protein
MEMEEQETKLRQFGCWVILEDGETTLQVTAPNEDAAKATYATIAKQMKSAAVKAFANCPHKVVDKK